MINIRPLDFVTFVCPMEGRSFDWRINYDLPAKYLHESLYLTENAAAMEQCNATGKQSQIGCFLRLMGRDVGCSIEETGRVRPKQGYILTQ